MEVQYSGDMMTLNMGPQHPSTHGVLRLELKTDGEVVADAKPHIGYLHRCFEKHCENVDYPGVVPFTDRLDYCAAMNQELGYVLAVEKLMGIQVNDRVRYLRIIMAELNRIASHLIAAGTYGNDIGTFTPFWWCFRDRETILDFFEETCGGRLLYNYNWIGGLMHDVQPDFEKRLIEFIDYFEPQVDNLNKILSDNHIFVKRTANVGILTPETAISYGVTGPNLRGSGVKFDVRKDEPYLGYEEFDFDVAVGFLHPVQDIAQGAGVVERRTARPLIPLVDFVPRCVLDLKTGVGAQTFHLPLEQQFRLRLVTILENGEFDAGRASIDHQNGLFHYAHPLVFRIIAP